MKRRTLKKRASRRLRDQRRAFVHEQGCVVCVLPPDLRTARPLRPHYPWRACIYTYTDCVIRFNGAVVALDATVEVQGPTPARSE